MKSKLKCKVVLIPMKKSFTEVLDFSPYFCVEWRSGSGCLHDTERVLPCGKKHEWSKMKPLLLLSLFFARYKCSRVQKVDNKACSFLTNLEL